MKEAWLISEESLEIFCTDLFTAHEIPKEEASIFANSLVKTELRGVKSHGMVRIPNYIDRINSKSMDKKTTIEIIKETNTTALMDAKNGNGMVASAKASQLAREKAKDNGVGIVSLRNSNHFGAAGIWSTEIAGQDMIGFATTNSEPIVSAPTGITRALGSNPFSFAAPINNTTHMCLDISNGQMALGKVFEYRTLEKKFPKGSWLDGEGNPTDDPFANKVEEFIMRPFGMHKGFGLTVMMEVLTSVLSGGLIGHEVPSIYRDIDKPNLVSQTFMAINIKEFQTLEDFQNRMQGLVDYLHELPVREGELAVLYPGEIEHTIAEQNQREGIVLADDVYQQLTSLAKDKNINPEKYGFKVAPEDRKIHSQI